MEVGQGTFNPSPKTKEEAVRAARMGKQDPRKRGYLRCLRSRKCPESRDQQHFFHRSRSCA